MNKTASLSRMGRVAAIAVLLTGSFQTVEAQNAAPAPQEAKLDAHVHLNLGAVTVREALKELSKQAGVVIEAEDYLEDRIVLLRMPDVSTHDFLNGISALNDWQWVKGSGSRFLLTRRSLNIPLAAASIPRRMQAALPLDWRTYLQISSPTANFGKINSTIPGEGGVSLRHKIQDRLFQSASGDRQALFASLQPGILKGDQFSFTNLKREDKSRLVRALVLSALHRTTFDLLHGDLLPYIANPSSATIELSGGTTLLIGTTVTNGDTTTSIGFGAAIASPPKEKQP